MAAYVVMERPGRDAAGDVVFVRDGFHWPAFLVPVLWLLWHRLWIEAALALAATLLLSALGEMAGLGISATLLTLLVSLYFGLEGAGLRVRALARRGWREWGVVEARNLGGAEQRYFLGAHEDATEVEPAPDRPAVSSAPQPVLRSSSHTAIGLVPYPGRS